VKRVLVWQRIDTVGVEYAELGWDPVRLQGEVVLVEDGTPFAANGRPLPELHGIADVDLSVTPSTNTPPIRRLGLSVGGRVDVTAAWVRLPSLDVAPLRQIYRRVEATTYQYDAPDLGFRAMLEVDEDGVVRKYGDLWTTVHDGSI